MIGLSKWINCKNSSFFLCRLLLRKIIANSNALIKQMRNIGFKKEKIILVIDDDIYCQKIAQLLLQILPYKITVASNGIEALRYLCKHRNTVALILSDITMPGMSGLEFLSILKHNPNLKNIPIILQSALESGDLRKGMRMGASDYIQKPYTSENLYSVINKIITREGNHERSMSKAH